MVWGIVALYKHICLGSLVFQGLLEFSFRLMVVGFQNCVYLGFKGVIVVPLKLCPSYFTRVRKKYHLSGAAFTFSFNKILWYLSKTVNISCLVCDCKKTSSKIVITFLLRISHLKNLLINAENAASPMDFIIE